MLRSMAFVFAAMLAASASAQESIKIAILGPMAFVQGENHWAGAEMARDEINKAGGIDVGGKKHAIELVARRHQRDPVGARRHQRGRARRSRATRSTSSIGGFRSEAVLAMQEVAMDYKKIFLGVGAAHSKLGAQRRAELRALQVLVPRHADQGRRPRRARCSRCWARSASRSATT